jgi:gentisate 1,2-dioxygenase
VLILDNPALRRGTTRTLLAAIQMIKGGEIVPADRHSQSALRFVIGALAAPACHGRPRGAPLHLFHLA